MKGMRDFMCLVIIVPNDKSWNKFARFSNVVKKKYPQDKSLKNIKDT